MSTDHQDKPPSGHDANASASTALAVLTSPEDTLETVTAQAERLLQRLRRIHFVPFESMAAKDAVPHLQQGPVSEVRHALDSTLKLLRALSRITGAEADFTDPQQPHSTQAVASYGEGGPMREGVPQPMLDAYAETLETWLAGDGITPGGAQGAEGPAQVRTLARMLETMAGHITTAHAFILERLAHPSKWGLIAAGEEGRRKARRTLRAAVILATRLMQPARAPKPLADEPDLLAEALASRELVMRARADLLMLVDVGMAVSDSDLGPQMREVRMRLVQLMGAQGYGDLRVSDRHVIGVNLTELNTWLTKPWNDFGAARQILNHVAETALRLGAINLRAVLLKHDRATQLQALALLEALEPEVAQSLAAPPAPRPALKKGQKPKLTAQQRRLLTVAHLVGTMRWRSSELQQFFESLSDEVTEESLTLQQVAPLTQMVRRALR
jgi:hypothetical protein